VPLPFRRSSSTFACLIGSPPPVDITVCDSRLFNYLDVKPEEVVRRLAGDTTRPLLQGENVDQRVRELMEQRGPVYEAAADIIVPVTGIEIDEIVEK